MSQRPLFENWLRVHLPLPHRPCQHALALVRRGDTSELYSYLSKEESALRERVAVVFSNKSVNLLHLCCMLGKAEVLECLLQDHIISILSVNSLDASGWSALHFASLINDPNSIKQLLSHQANPLLRNHRGATPAGLQQITLLRSPPKQLCWYAEAGDRLPIQIPEEELCRRIGSEHWTHCMVVDPELIERDWKEAEVTSAERCSDIDAAYQTFRKSPPELYLRRNLQIHGHEVVSKNAIQAGQILCEYCGQYDPENTVQSDSNYALGSCIEAVKYRSMGSMINDGWPNCYAFVAENQNGLENSRLLQSLRAIGANEVIAWDYGIFHPVKWGIYYFDNLDSLLRDCRTLFSRGSVEKLFNAFERGFENNEIYIERYQMHYIAHTPHLMLALIIKKVLTFNDLQFLADRIPDHVPDHPGARLHVERRRVFLSFLKSVNDLSSSPLVQASFDKRIGQSVFKIYYGMCADLGIAIPEEWPYLRPYSGRVYIDDVEPPFQISERELGAYLKRRLTEE
jgi:hypothetical protein